MTERLFSYGTLRSQAVQRAQFGRLLDGQPDMLVGWRLDMIEITDTDVLAKSGERFHPILRESGDASDRIEGVVFTLSAAEMLRADAYEVADYRRIRVTLHSGVAAWVYVGTKPARLPGERSKRRAG